MNARIPMSASSQDHVTSLLAQLTGAEGFPGVTPTALTPGSEWKLAKREYSALEVPGVGEGHGVARAVLALLTTGYGRCTAVVMTPGRVVCRVRFPTVPITYFRGTVLDGYMTDTAFVITDTIASEGRRCNGRNHPARMQLARELVTSRYEKELGCVSGAPEIGIDIAAARTLDALTTHNRGTHLLTPQDRTFAPGRVQPDTYLVSFAGLAQMLGGKDATSA